MKYIEEYRNSAFCKSLLDQIDKKVKNHWTIMEICGGQTHSLVKSGIVNLLPEKISIVHGPGCPVCVTPIEKIDLALQLAGRKEVIFTSFGDMLRVPGSNGSLLKAKSKGADIRIVYSPLEAVKIAERNLDKDVVFFAVGFETTAPANALAIKQAYHLELKNFSLLSSHVLVPPAIEAILSADDNQIQGFLTAGHVCAVMGIDEYKVVAEKFDCPMVITGFEPVDLLRGILKLIELLENDISQVENAYSRAVRLEGNREAQVILEDVFEIIDKEWRGMGIIPSSGFGISAKYGDFDAERKYDLMEFKSDINNGCIAGDILRGAEKPIACPHFGKECTPINPLGAPMVSSEGACAAYYNYNTEEIVI